MSGLTDNQLIRIVASALDAAVVAGGFNNEGDPLPVIQLDQPTQQGTPTAAAIFFQNISDNHYGWPSTTKVLDNSTPPNFIYAETQLCESTFQISGLVKQDPSDIDRPTAKDVVTYMKMYIGSSYMAQQFQAVNGIGILRVTDVRNPSFEDDSHQYEYRPSFDITFCYRKIINFVVPSTDTAIGATKPGIPGQGTFPVMP
jgi:hypothetical protein